MLPDHTTATALILNAAKKAGLIDSVAEALCFVASDPGAHHRRCELHDALADAFDDHICLPAIAAPYL
jgi:hypothetical protein